MNERDFPHLVELELPPGGLPSQNLEFDAFRREHGVARERHGLFRCGASAAARVRRPSIQNIRERYSDRVPPGPNTWTLNVQPLGRFRPHRSFLLARSTLPSSVARLPLPPGKAPVCFDDL